MASVAALRAEQDEKIYRTAVENLEKAKAAFEGAEDKEVAERLIFYRTVCEQELRERKTGATPDMACLCGKVKGRGFVCSYCDRWRKALYGGQTWVRTGYYHGSLC
jgi:hypothetical protein